MNLGFYDCQKLKDKFNSNTVLYNNKIKQIKWFIKLPFHIKNVKIYMPEVLLINLKT
jgi:hypothetical protein